MVTHTDDGDSDRDFHFDRRLFERVKLWFDRNVFPTFLHEGTKVPDRSVMHVYTSMRINAGSGPSGVTRAVVDHHS